MNGYKPEDVLEPSDLRYEVIDQSVKTVNERYRIEIECGCGQLATFTAASVEPARESMRLLAQRHRDDTRCWHHMTLRVYDREGAELIETERA